MNRVVLASVTVAALAGASVLGWFEVRQTRDFRRLLAVGDAALARDQTSAAVEAFSGAIALRRDSMLGWLKRGDTYRRRGDLTSAVRDLEQAARLDPTALRPIELLGDVNDALGHHARAINLYSRFVVLDDRAPRVLYKLALAHYRAGRAAAAIDPVKKAIALDRQFAEAYYLLGLCEREARHTEQAAAALNRALSINPSFIAAREELASVEAARGRRRDSIEQLEAVAALEAERPDRLIDVAIAYARTGRLDPAVLTLARAADRYPKAASVYLTLARIWLDVAEQEDDAGAAAKADAALREAAAREAQAVELSLLRGRAQLFAGDARTAERSLQAATATLPADPAAFRYLADAAQQLGHRDVAQIARARYEALTQ
jgi:tetratricopeptide (TPR) repeat protein